jgi:branched-chain amino acid transport system permease protein
MTTAADGALLQNAIDAVSLGSLFALFALGIALIFGVMGLINFAHGELIMVGGLVLVYFGDIPLLLKAAVVLAVVIVLALAIERTAFRPVRGAPPATLLVTSFAVSFLLQNLTILLFDSRPKTTNVSSALTGSFQVGSLTVPKLSVATVVVTVVLLIGLHSFLVRTSFGTQMRAAAEDFQTARIVGVKANRVVAAAFALSGLLAGAAAFLLVAQTGTVTPTMGVSPVIFGFIAAVVGGLGSLGGAVLGGYLVGAVTVALQAGLPVEMRPYRDFFVFLAIFVMLVFRPNGLVITKASVTRV